MSDAQFPSGQWFGFYTYSGHSRRYLMDLVLEFKNGRMTGHGSDGIGPFIISGIYHADNGECSWAKQYVGRHTVDYKGYRETKGIWGTWSITHSKGGFHIWPLGEGGCLAGTEAEQTEPAKQAQPAIHQIVRRS